MNFKKIVTLSIFLLSSFFAFGISKLDAAGSTVQVQFERIGESGGEGIVDLTNLTGYIWNGSDDISWTPEFSYSINFTSNSNNYTTFSFYISIKYDDTSVYDTEDHYWLDDNYSTVLFTGGDDATNTTFISWLEANGTLTPPAPASYEVTFVTNGGTSVTKLEDVEELPTPLPTTTKANNIFVGWFYDSEFEIQAFSGDTISSNITLYAKWDVADVTNPIVNGKTDYITNVNNPISESDIKAGLYAIDNVDGNIPSTSFVLVSDGYTANKNILGTYDIVYKVSDSAGNESQVTVKVHVVDVTKPIINGQNTYTIVYNQTQSLTAVLNSLTVTDNYQSGIIPVLVEDNYTENKAIKGSYTVKYKATDNSGNESDLFVVTINVVDTIKPVITGTSSYTHVYNNKLELSTIKAALTANDGYDGNITENITLKSDNYTANYNKKGSYQIVYSVKDSSNNVTDYTITVNVVDSIKPIISGQAIYNTGSQVQLSEATIRAALTAVDDYDGALDLQLVSNGYSSHFEEIRSHKITYKATDSSGNFTEFVVTVNVFDDVPPVIYTNDAFINIDGTLNYTLQQIIDHLINVGDLQASVNFDNYYVSTSDYDPSTPGEYEVVLIRSELAPESLKERVSVGIRVLEPNPIPTNPDPTPDDSSTPVNIWPYLVGTFIAGIFIIAFINRKKR